MRSTAEGEKPYRREAAGHSGEVEADRRSARRGTKGRTDPRGAAKSKGSVQRRGVQAGWWVCDLDQMAQDFEHLWGVCDDGEHPHGLATARAGQGIHLVDCFREVKKFFSRPPPFFCSAFCRSFCSPIS